MTTELGGMETVVQVLLHGGEGVSEVMLSSKESLSPTTSTSSFIEPPLLLDPWCESRPVAAEGIMRVQRTGICRQSTSESNTSR